MTATRQFGMKKAAGLRRSGLYRERSNYGASGKVCVTPPAVNFATSLV